jgi:arylsulfatase A-like enzyme
MLARCFPYGFCQRFGAVGRAVIKLCLTKRCAMGGLPVDGPAHGVSFSPCRYFCTLLMTAIFAWFIFGASAVQGQEARRSPNIILLVADDWGFSDVGAFGAEFATPNLDRLAYEGVRFSNFHVAGSCAPTRAMLQTGVMNHRAGLGNMAETIPDAHVGKPGYDTVLNLQVVTLAEMLKAAGYATYFTGKWHLGSDSQRLPHVRGYDRAFSLDDAGADNFEQKPITGLSRRAEWMENGKPAALPKDYYSSRFLVDKMIDYIDQGRGDGERRPFFASVNFLANHIPLQAPDADLARYRGQYQQGWDAVRAARAQRAGQLGMVPANVAMARMATTQDWAKLSAEQRDKAAREMQAYAAMATAMDREIGRLVAHLQAIGEYENSLIIFLSDNGAEPTDPYNRLRNRLFLNAQLDNSLGNIGRRGSMSVIGPSWASAAASPLKGYKFSAAEGGLRVPLILHWAGGNWPSGAIASGFAHVTDLAPTIAQLAGAALPKGSWQGRPVEPVTGRSLLPMLAGGSESVHGDEPLGYELAGNSALFRGGYKLMRNLPPTGTGEWELYDLTEDMGETRNLADAQPETFASMLADYQAYAKANGVLDMPAGYRSDDQINLYAMRQQGMRPWIIGGAVLLVLAGLIGGAVILWRRRRAVRVH